MQTFSLDHFDEFLTIANQQPTPQTLLLVLAARELPTGHTTEQAEQFALGTGGHLAPIGGIAKPIQQLCSFSEFVEETLAVAEQWDAVFVAAIDSPPVAEEFTEVTHKLIDKMSEDIRSGIVSRLLTFDRTGKPMQLTKG